MSDIKNNLLVVLVAVSIILSFLVLGAFGVWYYNEKIVKPQPSPSPAATLLPTPIVSPTLMPTPTPGESPTTSPVVKSDIDQIKEAFALKYDKPIGDVNVNISQNDGTYASGGVSFAGEISGAMWLAYNDGSGWIIVYDGHGTIPCEPIETYSFPVDLVPECFDESTSTLITR